MRKALHLIAATIVGLIVGSVVNMGLINLGASVMPMPGGADTTTVEGLKASLPLFEPRHFTFPFLAHALGTLAGAIVATLLAPGRTSGPAWVVGVAFLVGGIASVVMLPAPVWFSALDLLLAYLPMAWLGHRLVAAMFPGRRRAAV
ncbi:hypothetical protein [Luteimonas sp. MC1828]|uniref:hypothetical protein n=1 Tax=Luteimonas sp. MC1828 TaxID=2799787 RepID=UPI0018F25A49|nr:hypothetical protein [Luteimonas sp. MC1828]MBJ7575264.1 hypothetical protein [Luteimonas sp. MC1828]